MDSAENAPEGLPIRPMQTIIDKSLARGSARMVLREARHDFEEKLPALTSVEHTSTEKSARRTTDTLVRLLQEQMVFVRTEFAKKRSMVLFCGFDVRVENGQEQLWAFSALSQNGSTDYKWFRYKISQHALERVQQRKIGIAFNLGTFVDEFAISLPLTLGATQSSASGPDRRLIPTQNGALMSVRDEANYRIGTTWVSQEQLSHAQRLERGEGLAGLAQTFPSILNPDLRKTFSGRNDRVQMRMRDSLAQAVPNLKNCIAN